MTNRDTSYYVSILASVSMSYFYNGNYDREHYDVQDSLICDNSVSKQVYVIDINN